MVKGERPIVKVAGSKLTYDMPLLLKKESADNVYDALKLIPGVTDNNGSLTLAGNAFNVLINGKHYQMDAAQLNALLKSLPANRLKHAEVMYTTPARYEVRGASINLDIASDSSQPDGWQGELTGAWNQEHEAMWSEKAGLIYHKGKLDFSVNYQHNHGKTYGTTDETSLHHLDDGTTHDIETHETQRSRDHEHQWRMGVDYAFTDNHRLSLSYTGNYDTEHAREDVTGNVMATNAYRTRKTMHDVMLDYQLPTGTKVNVEYTYYIIIHPRHSISSAHCPRVSSTSILTSTSASTAGSSTSGRSTALRADGDSTTACATVSPMITVGRPSCPRVTTPPPIPPIHTAGRTRTSSTSMLVPTAR